MAARAAAHHFHVCVSVCVDPLLAQNHSPPRIRRDYPLNLSISVSGGKETNRDFLSSGERNGMSPAHNLPGHLA